MRSDKGGNTEIGSAKFLEQITSVKKTEISKKPEKHSPVERQLAKNLLAIRNKARLKALNQLGNHLHDKRLKTDLNEINNTAADTILNLQKNLLSVGGPKLVKEFLTTPYALQFIEDFADYDAEKLALVFHVRSMVTKVIEEKYKSVEDKKQFVPAITLGAFVAIEKLHSPEFKGKSIGETIQILQSQESKAELWTEKNLCSNLIKYLTESKLDNNTPKFEWEHQVVGKVATDIGARLDHWNNLRKTLGQSQGVEVEMLQWEDRSESPNWVKKHKIAPFLPRGLDPEKLARTDWMMLGLLGLKEDLGERMNELYEASTLPTETMASQTTILYELLMGGFIDPKEVMSGREKYSMHISTIFPTKIFDRNSIATKQYVDFSRAMGGAFSSLNRLKYGGWVSYEDDGWDYEISWGEKDKQKIKSVPGKQLNGDDLLVEIRTLDLTGKDFLSATLQKEFLDYGFRAYWMQVLGEPPTNSRDLQAANVWQDFMQEINNINTKYDVKDHWQGPGNTREKHPEYQDELKRIIRDNAGKIRRLSELPDAEITKYTVNGERPITTRPTEVKINEELKGLSMSLTEEMANKLGIENKGLYTLKVGGTVGSIRVESTNKDNRIGASKELLDKLPFIESAIPRLRFDKDRQELSIGPVIGIAATETGSNPDKPFNNILDWPLLNAQLESAKKAGAIVYVFDPDRFSVKDGHVKAYMLEDESSKTVLDDSAQSQKIYRKVTMPTPDIIYDWSSTDIDSNLDYAELLSRVRVSNEGSIAPVSTDKLDFYTAMCKVPAIKERMPEVIAYTSKKDLSQMLDKHGYVVMKPRWGEEGASILYIRKLKDGSIEYTNPHWEAPKGGIEKDEVWTIPPYKQVKNIDSFLDQTKVTRSTWTMLLQQGVEMLEFPDKGWDGRKNMEIRTVIYRAQNGNLAVLGSPEKIKLNSDRMATVLSHEQAIRIATDAQTLSLLSANQLDAVLGKGTTSLVAMDVFVDKNGKIWLGESNSGPTLVWYNNPTHPYLLHNLATEQIKTCIVQSGFAPAGSA